MKTYDDAGRQSIAGEPLKRRTIRSFFWSGVNVAVPSLAGMTVFLVASRVLSVSEFGIVAFCASVATTLSAFNLSGIGEAIVQKLNIDHGELNQFFYASLFLSFVTFAVVILFSLSPFIAEYTDNRPELLQLLGLKIILDAVNFVPAAIIERNLRFSVIATRTVVGSLAGAAFALALLYAGYGLWALAWSYVISQVLITTISIWASGWVPGALRPQQLFSIPRYAFFATGTRLLNVTSIHVDQAVTAVLLGPASVGLLSFAKRVYGFGSEILAGAIGAVAHPTFSAIQKDLPRVTRGYLMTSFGVASLAFPLFIGLMSVAPTLIPLLFHPRWVEAVGLIQMLCLLGLISSIGTLQAGLVKGMGRADWWFYFQVVGFVTTILTVFVFSQFGLTVLVAALVTRSYLFWFIPVLMTSRLLRLGVRSYLFQFWPPIVASAVMMLAIGYVDRSLQGHDDFLRLTAAVGTGVIVYAAAFSVCALPMIRTRFKMT